MMLVFFECKRSEETTPRLGYDNDGHAEDSAR